MTKTLASIDIGTHTARLLVAEESEPPRLFRPLLRKRAYIRLAEGLSQSGKKFIHSTASDRTLEVLEDFSNLTKKLNVRSVTAVATGIVREAENSDEFLRRIYDYTGIRVKTITGNEEALLTEKGVSNALNIQEGPFFLFDLGGGSTEFLFGGDTATVIRSLPLGAMILTQEYLKSDPPERSQVDALSKYIDQCLKKADFKKICGPDPCSVVGTGGTVTTLAAMLYGIALKEITPERINGLVLKRRQIEMLFDRIRHRNFKERSGLPGLDAGRAEVILAGCLIVTGILCFFRFRQVIVSLSDLLEGILIECFEGEGNGEK